MLFFPVITYKGSVRTYASKSKLRFLKIIQRRESSTQAENKKIKKERKNYIWVFILYCIDTLFCTECHKKHDVHGHMDLICMTFIAKE